MNVSKGLFLGAGASVNYGYPTGTQLIDNMLTTIENDSVFFPVFYKNINQQSYSLRDFITNINQLGDLNKLKEKPGGCIDSITEKDHIIPPHSNKYLGIKIRLDEIKEFHELHRKLYSASPTSIDEFIKYYPSFELSCKALIIYELLKCEQDSKFYDGAEIDKDGKPIKGKHWYAALRSDLINAYLINRTLPNFKLLSFNYDVSLDYWLEYAISDLEILTAEEKRNLINHFKVYHVYGNIYGEEPYTYGQYTTQNLSGDLGNLIRLDKSIKLSSNILTMHEQKLSVNFGSIQDFKEITFLGYSFHSLNNDVIGFPYKKENKEENNFFPGRVIKILNFGGEDKMLDREMNRIQKEAKKNISAIGGLSSYVSPSIFMSNETNILTAYQRDLQPF